MRDPGYELLKKKLRAWRCDLGLFMKQALRAKLTTQQEIAARALSVPGSRVSIKAGHGVGKTFFAAGSCLWLPVCFSNSCVYCTAPTHPQLDLVLHKEITQAIYRMPYWLQDLFTDNDDLVYFGPNKKDRFIAFRSTANGNEQAMQGAHNKYILFVQEEAGGVSDAVQPVIKGALSTQGARSLKIGNPVNPFGHFYNDFHRNKGNPRLKTFTFSCLDSLIEDGGLVSQEYIDDCRREYGVGSDLWRSRVTGEFPRAGEKQLIATDLLEEAFKRKLAAGSQNFAPNILGVDVCEGGSDRAVIWHRQGLSARVMWWKFGARAEEIGEHVKYFGELLNADYTFVDYTGVGSGTITYLNQYNYPVIPIHFGSVSDNLELYYNKRAEMFKLLEQWLDTGGAIYPLDHEGNDISGKIMEEATAIKYSLTSKDQLQLVRKEDIKKEIGVSPDFPDALALTFANGITPPKPVKPESGAEQVRAKQVYSFM